MSTDNTGDTPRKLTQAEMDAALGADGPIDSDADSQFDLLRKVDEVNKSLTERWTEYMATVARNSERTIELMLENLGYFDIWLKAKIPNKTYLELTKDEIRDYVQFCVDKGNRPGYIALKFRSIKNLFYFMVEEEGLLQINPCPIKARIRSQASDGILVKYAELLQCRDNANSNISIDRVLKRPSRRNVLNALRKYTAFEVLLSTGMTVGELTRINLTDVDFNDTIYDKELEKNSPYVYGSITLNPEFIGIKKRRPRKVYLGRLAAKLLKLHVYHTGIHGNIPIFPFDTYTIQRWMQEIAEGVIKEPKKLAEIPEETLRKLRRNKYRTEVHIDPNSILSSELVKSIKKQQARAVLRNQYEVKAEYKYAPRMPALNPHAIRHIFACVMMHRSWSGMKRDFLFVKRILGHKVNSKSTVIYLDHEEYIDTDKQWVRLFEGTAKDYWFLFIKLEELNPIKHSQIQRKRKSHHKKGTKYNP